MKRKRQQMPAVKSTASPIIVHNITVRPTTRKKQEIDLWRNYTRAAEGTIPRRTDLYDLYTDIVTTDGHVIAVWGKRVDAVTSADWQFTDKDGNVVEEINQLIDCTGFGDLLKEIVNTIGWGNTWLEPSFFVNDNGQHEMKAGLIPRKHIRPHTGIVAKEQNGDTGINANEGIYARTIMKVGNADDLGLFLSAAQYVIYKRGDIGDWAEFIEIFGRGIIDAQWDGQDEGQKKMLADGLNQMGGSGVLIRPEGTTVDIKQPTGNANGQLQEAFASFCNKEISKGLLGSTETSESSKSSGHAQAEIHGEQDAKKNASDIDMTRRILNSEFIKVLKAAGFDTKGGTFTLKSKKKISKDEFEIHKSMANELSIPIDHDFFYETYGVPKPTSKTDVTGLKPTNAVDIADDTPPANLSKETEKAKKKEQKPSSIKLSDSQDAEGRWLAHQIKRVSDIFLSRMNRFFVSAPVETAGATTQLSCCGDHLITLSDSHLFDNEALISRIWEGKGSLTFDVELFNFTAKTLLKGFHLGWHKHIEEINLVDLGFIYDSDDPALITAFEMNLAKFSSAKTLAEAQKLNQLFREAKTQDIFRTNARNATSVFNNQWLQTELTTAILVANATVNQQRLNEDAEVYPFWELVTRRDENVRDTHRALDGLTLPANDPLWSYLSPLLGWGCRCRLIGKMKHEVKEVDFDKMRARAEAYFTTDDFARMKKQGFGGNRANTGEVFTANQMYTQSFDKVAKELKKLEAKAYGLKPFEEARLIATSKMPEATEDLNTFSGLIDHHGRKITVNEQALNTPLKGHLNAVRDALNKPDEVWISGGDFREYITIKYYDDQTLIVVSKIKNGQIYEVESWLPVLTSTDIEGYRSGLLIFSNNE